MRRALICGISGQDGAYLARFLLEKGYVYRGLKPVNWCFDCGSALAEAEVEYEDRKDIAVDVGFPFADAEKIARAFGLQTLPAKPGYVVIWTTTPWTLPGNRAIAYGTDFDYVVATVATAKDGSLARPGEKLVVAAKLLPRLEEAAGFTAAPDPLAFKGAALAGSVARHPLAGQGYDFAVPLQFGRAGHCLYVNPSSIPWTLD